MLIKAMNMVIYHISVLTKGQSMKSLHAIGLFLIFALGIVFFVIPTIIDEIIYPSAYRKIDETLYEGANHTIKDLEKKYENKSKSEWIDWDKTRYKNSKNILSNKRY